MVRGRHGGIGGVCEKRYWREADALAVIEAWKRSGMSLSGFARDHGLDRNRISRWATRLRTRSGGAVRFHPVRLVEGQRGAERADAIEVVLGDGRRVRVPEGFATADLERVLVVLEGRA